MQSLGAKPRKGAVFQCNNCQKDVYKLPTYCGRKTHFCNSQCAREFSKHQAFTFSCVVCSKVVRTQPSQIALRNRKHCSRSCSDVSRRAAALERRKTYTQHQLDRLARYSTEAEAWRKAVFARDDYTCQACGERGGYLEAHHDLPFAYFPELRFELLNGSTLCRPCHDTTKVPAKSLRAIWAPELLYA